ncbi:hypothetical protein A2803_06000 [Candidatus Woesebacteria bacterium RIFCSPHIGHO2_01_FULL_44_21]|uniref:DOT1 domain-containing protein n=1 Tax=Candidatus Woesebacteria bacterium RIFCSPHIGHO2_01_FULL_44_21 TaxID=1802503 RepID=A0A1F7YZY9_9BACT|nr:MAG: hypothetical protein A2803_06000 [Candidatus Woesebacteria bacterium RIFCSPHIGHO2_01_FULL_44_21]OGM71068.1 MAG: hypothetical protein A2897_02425 [Candidatus Woesebacteria bacterium RIFCSPLOWO2_01_FULL_44_24b]
MEDPNSKPEIEQNDEVAKKLADFAESEVLPEWKWPPKTRMHKDIGGWYPTWKENPGAAFGFLRRTFETVARNFQERGNRKPIFLDLGSGDGMIPTSAASTEAFSNCYGVEYKPQLNSWSEENIRKLEEAGTLIEGSVKLIPGSYYTSKHWPAVQQKYKERQVFLGTPQEEIDEVIEKNKDVVHALNKGLLDENGKLIADVIYWFPSDRFLVDSQEQWNEIIRPGTFLILGPSGQILDMEKTGFLNNFEHIKDYHLKGAEHGQFGDLSVYIKK